MTDAGFGLAGFGLGAFGGSGDLMLLAIRPRGTNELEARFSRPPRAFDRLGHRDALNERKWTIEAVDPRIPSTESSKLYTPPGAVVPTKRVWIGQVLASADPSRLRLRTVPQLEPGVVYEIGLAASVEGAKCETLVGPTTDRVVGRQRPSIPRGRQILRDPYVDWANPFWRGGEAGPGYWTQTGSGDIALADGLESLKTRVYRRIVTAVGAFAAYGRGYGTRLPVGAALRSQTLQRLADDIREQVSKEPDVRTAGVVASRVETGRGVVVEVETTITRISGRAEPAMRFRVPT